MNPVEKALRLRRSVKMRSREPDAAFSRRLKWPRKILSSIQDHQTDNGLLAEARRQYIVCLCAAFEIYWRDLFRVLVDRVQSDRIDTRKLKSHRFTFQELNRILGQRLTLGELVSSSYTFHGTDVIDLACQEVFGIELYGRLAKAEFKIEAVGNSDGIEPFVFAGTTILQNRPDIERCFDIRHETVHNTGTLYRPSNKTVQKLEGAMRTFNIFCTLALESELSDDHGEGRA